jgi:hypothetical protein
VLNLISTVLIRESKTERDDDCGEVVEKDEGTTDDKY